MSHNNTHYHLLHIMHNFHRTVHSFRSNFKSFERLPSIGNPFGVLFFRGGYLHSSECCLTFRMLCFSQCIWPGFNVCKRCTCVSTCVTISSEHIENNEPENILCFQRRMNKIQIFSDVCGERTKAKRAGG